MQPMISCCLAFIVSLGSLVATLPSDVSGASTVHSGSTQTAGVDRWSTSSTVGAQFIHQATEENTVLGVTIIDHPLANNDPNALLFVTPNWHPHGVDYIHNLSVSYNGYNHRWGILSQDNAPIPHNAAFNVLIPPADMPAFVHRATSSNRTNNWTEIDHPLTNGNPQAIILVTPNWNPGGGVLGTYNNHAIGVFYRSSTQRWAIFNQDLAAMPVGAAFNVLIPAANSAAFVHQATTANIDGDSTLVDHPSSNGQRQVLVFVTQNWNPGGIVGAYNNHVLGVYYHANTQKWMIFNQDYVNMPVYAAFNVLVVSNRHYLPAVRR